MPSRVAIADRNSALILEATDLGWLGKGDEADWDQCVHGVATCTVGSIAITSRDCNLTAASLFLLRTLEHDHTDAEPVAPSNKLFPHCGHSPWVVSGERFPTLNMGCDSGDELWVRHEAGAIHLSRGELHERVSTEAWENAVARFADQVRAFYDASPPRRRSTRSQSDAMESEGWDAFWAEWVERRTQVRPASAVSRPAFVEDISTLPRLVRHMWARCVRSLWPRKDTPAQ
jgi:hypothetical protein